MADGTFFRPFRLGDLAEGWSGNLNAGLATIVSFWVLEIGGGLTGDPSLSTSGEASSFEAISAGLRLVGDSGWGPIGSIILEASSD